MYSFSLQVIVFFGEICYNYYKYKACSVQINNTGKEISYEDNLCHQRGSICYNYYKYKACSVKINKYRKGNQL